MICAWGVCWLICVLFPSVLTIASCIAGIFEDLSREEDKGVEMDGFRDEVQKEAQARLTISWFQNFVKGAVDGA